MQIRIRYEAQAKQAAGIGSETIDVDEPCRVSDCIHQIANTHAGTLKSILLNAEGKIQSTLLLFREDEQIGAGDDTELSDGDTLTIMTPISGG